MKTNSVVVANANELYGEVTKKLEELKTQYVGVIESIEKEDLDSAFYKAGVLINCVVAAIKKVRVNDAQFPEFLIRKVTTNEDKLTDMTIIVTSKLKAERKFKHEFDVKVDGDFVVNVGNGILDALFPAYYAEEASENIKEVNEKLDSLYEKYGLKRKVKFIIDTDNVGRVYSIDDDVLVIRADVDKALDASKLGIMADGDEYATLINEESEKQFVDVMSTVVITPEILKKRIAVVDALADVRTKKHVNKIIRESYHKQAVYLKSAKSGVGYFNGKVGDANVFALVKMNDNGEYEVVLSPFDTEALIPVNVDIVSLIKDQK